MEENGKERVSSQYVRVTGILFSVCVCLSCLIAHKHTYFKTLECDDWHAQIKLFPIPSGDQIEFSERRRFLFNTVEVH